MRVKVSCHKCGKIEEFDEKVGFRAECACGEDLHCCMNCEFYDPNHSNDCRETSADPVREKDRANYCEYYRPSGNNKGADDKKNDLLVQAEALFKKS